MRWAVRALTLWPAAASAAARSGPLALGLVLSSAATMVSRLAGSVVVAAGCGLGSGFVARVSAGFTGLGAGAGSGFDFFVSAGLTVTFTGFAAGAGARRSVEVFTSRRMVSSTRSSRSAWLQRSLTSVSSPTAVAWAMRTACSRWVWSRSVTLPCVRHSCDLRCMCQSPAARSGATKRSPAAWAVKMSRPCSSA